MIPTRWSLNSISPHGTGHCSLQQANYLLSRAEPTSHCHVIVPQRRAHQRFIERYRHRTAKTTAARLGEVRWAVWSEINLTDGTWTLPATRAWKAKKEHHSPFVPLAPWRFSAKCGPQGVAALGWPSPERAGSPSPTRCCASCFNRMASQPCRPGAGCRSGIGLADETDHPREVVKAALRHVLQNTVEAAYKRTDLFERRRPMNDWSAYLAGRRAGTET